RIGQTNEDRKSKKTLRHYLVVKAMEKQQDRTRAKRRKKTYKPVQLGEDECWH
ncbi:hypothetical protein BaRGS_00035109, partial [Batillaria attramentaria]